MISSVLLSAVMLVGALAGDGVPTDPSDVDRYKSAAAAAGHDAGAHVRLALWCEAHGMAAERTKHLSLALLYQPSNVLARGLMGLVGHQGQWDRPEDIGEQVRNNPAHQARVREYLDRRMRTPHQPDAQMKLAAWCDDKRLKEQAVAHYNEVIRLDPSRDSAWKRLGYKRQGNRWIKPEDLVAQRQELARQKQADKRWKPKLEKLRNDLQSKDAAKRAKAEQGLAEVTDPRAVPMIWAIFVPASERHQIVAVQMLGQIDGPSASTGLAALAVFSPVPEVRSRATESLVRRDPRDVVGRLILMIHKPFTYQVRPVQGPGSPGELFVEGERFNLQRFYENQTSGFYMGLGRMFSPDVPFDPFSIRNLVMAMPAYATNPFGMTVMGANTLMTSASSSLPVSPHSAGQAAQAIAANPQNTPAILNQLENNPANRLAPPGFWFALTNPGDMVPYPRNMAAFVKQVQAHQGDPNSPLHRAIELGQIENNPANRGPGAAMGMMLQAQQGAAQRDLQIGQDLARVAQSNQNLRQQLAMDVQLIESINAEIKFYDDRVLPILKAITGLDLGTEQEKWKNWWKDQLGYAYRSNAGQPEIKPTYRDSVSDFTQIGSVEPSPMPERAPTYIKPGENEPVSAVPARSCLAAGTLVQTIDGPRSIEFIQVGDQVLCQSTSTGMLTFQPMVASHRNQPAPTFRVTAGSESIVATGIQRFWKASKGWTMTCELKAGDRLRTLGGVVAVASIETDKTQPVYNVDVAQNMDLFVGTKRLLAHDFSLVQPVLEPFDRQPELATPPSPAR